MNLETRVQLLEDRQELLELRATYCFLVDDNKFIELVNQCFTNDAECDFRNRLGDSEPLISRGREQILRFFEDVVAQTLNDMSHTVHNHRIVINGDQASGDCYFELTARQPESLIPMVGAGRYLDTYQRVDNHWKISQRNADIFYITPLGE